ncbi:transcriptional regulator ZurR [Sporosarcina sp. NCCP-2716]|uniref:Fur family transcriptional regulator n=1 Tax=Sporosarcina sp. NCCP-2716 TaxID=2943679 RepID=UPI00203C7207|nr:Fur family transcriptional regulator [Sporosarcina sp. NCCP-2716]GKV68070.1 transcriptional regulator ZurR [Sporosarcina sp. NCCP-2716]
MNVEKAWTILKDHSFKRTKNREAILHYLAQQDGYTAAMDVSEFLKRENPGLSYDTVYRNLATFADLGILEETDLHGERQFRMHCDPGVHHHHFICTVCGRTKHIPSCPMDLLAVELPGVEIEGHKFEVYGKCPSCK